MKKSIAQKKTKREKGKTPFPLKKFLKNQKTFQKSIDK